MAPILAGLTFGMTPMIAMAQDEDQDEDQETAQELADIERLVVTGTRLRTNQNIQSPNPVVSVGEEEITARGITRIEDMVNVLPQVFAAQTTEVSNGATGTATLDLRGLGAIRTLTLINGRRLPFGSPFSSPADANIVPTSLVERVDVVTGGASAVYGSDAVSGVVNFILKRDFEGIELDAQGSFNQSGNNASRFERVLEAGQVDVPGSTTDGRELRVALTMGANTPNGRGNVTLHTQYENLNAITQDGRVFSACALGGSTGQFSSEGIGCVGSSNFRRFANFAPGIGDDVFLNEDGTLRFAGEPFETTPETAFNFGPANFFQRPVERFQIYTQGYYELTDEIEAFAELSFNNTSSDAQVAASASFGSWTINCDNPLIQGQQPISLFEVFGCNTPNEDGVLPNEVGPVFASHRLVEGDPRNSNLDLTNWRTIGGIRGTLFDQFDFELFGQFARTTQTDISSNDLLIDNVQEALLVVADENGNPVCSSGNPDCVPFNIFNRTPDGQSLVTDEAANFVTGVGITTGQVQQWVFGGNIQTDLGRFGIQSPFANDGVGLLVGGEFRQDELTSVPDEISQRADGGFTGVGGPTLPVSGKIHVHEFFLESQVPLISDKPLIENFSIGGAYRFSDYTTEGAGIENDFTTDTWHVFANWTPVESVRLRGQFQRAIRAPNVIELFTPQGTGLPNLTLGANGFFDPCAGPDPRATFEQCAQSGVTEEQFGSIPDVISGQTQSITSGNPLLDPEEADTWTFGVIFTPDRLIPGLSISIDYFDIELDDAIQPGIPAQTVLNECIATGEELFCGLITRDASGSLIAGTAGVGFDATNINIATLETSGFDFQVLYDLNLRDIGLGDSGSVRFDYAGTYLDDLNTIPAPDTDPIECAGKVAGSCDAPSPEYRHRLLTTWQTPWNLTLNTTWRFFGSTDNFQGDDVSPSIDRKADSRNYIDLAANYDLSRNLNLRMGVNNVFDKQPPVITSAGPALGNGNTFPGSFDIGRFFFFGATYRL